MASALQKIELDLKGIFSTMGSSLQKFGSAFWKLFGKAPTALQAINNFIGEAAPTLIAVVQLADPEAEPEVAEILSRAETGLAAIQASASSATSGSSLLANLTDFAATIPGDLKAVQVKNPVLQAKITSFANFIVAEAKVLIPAMENWIVQLKAKAQPVQGAGGAPPAAPANTAPAQQAPSPPPIAMV